MRDEKMRGKDGQWVRPHPGPFIWNQIEKEKGKFTWEKADKYVVYAQQHNQTMNNNKQTSKQPNERTNERTKGRTNEK